MKEAALYVASFDFAAWVLSHLDGSGALAGAIHNDALTLLDHVVLALKGVDRRHHIDEADATNALLRVRLRLAHQLELFDERRMLFLIEQLDDIGRQLGGWLRRLDGEGKRHR